MRAQHGLARGVVEVNGQREGRAAAVCGVGLEGEGSGGTQSGAEQLDDARVVAIDALISLAHDASTRLNEPTHALRKDVVVSDKGVYFRRYFDKGSKRFQDVRTQTSRASARPGSPLCVVARLRAYLACAKLGTDALLFPRREPATGAIVLDAAGAPALYSEHYYKRDFRAVAAAAGIANAASLSPRGLRSGGAMDDRLAGLSQAELDDKIGWGAKKKAQPLYVRGNEIGLELDRAARAGATRPRTH